MDANSSKYKGAIILTARRGLDQMEMYLLRLIIKPDKMSSNQSFPVL